MAAMSAAAAPAAILVDMGMNPFRSHRRSAADYVMVVAALLVCAGLVAWAALG
jgi:hypothetical protein